MKNIYLATGGSMGTEIWKGIKGFELYEVSNFGRVRSVKLLKNNTIKTHILTEHIHKGYYQVGLCKDRKVYTKAVHTLVANAFIPNPHKLKEVNHKDENKLNNSADNLEWCTHAQNIRYGTGIKRHSKKIMQLNKDGSIVKVWDSLAEASLALCGKKSNNTAISACARNVKGHHTALGYKWRFVQ